MTESEYFDPAELAHIAESIDPSEVVETEDYSDFGAPAVGWYLNPYREITKVTRKNDGSVTVTLSLTGGLHNGSSVVGQKFPYRAWASSTLFSRGADTPGKTSGLAQYLSACGFETRGQGLADMLRMLPETLNIPVQAFMGRTDKGEKLPSGEWSRANLKTKDFEIGRDDSGLPKYGQTATKDGKTYQAQGKVQGFREVR